MKDGISRRFPLKRRGRDKKYHQIHLVVEEVQIAITFKILSRSSSSNSIVMHVHSLSVTFPVPGIKHRQENILIVPYFRQYQ